MKNNKLITHLLSGLFLAVAALAGTANAWAFPAQETQGVSAAKQAFLGRYQEINTQSQGDIPMFTYSDDGIFLGVGGLFDLFFGYKDESPEVTPIDNGVVFDCVLKSMHGMDGEENVPATITLKEDPAGGYTLDLAFEGNPGAMLSQLNPTTRMFKFDGDDRICGSVPAKLGDKVTMAGLIKAAAPYVFTPEMLATRIYLRDRSPLADTEVVRQDERNRYLEYAWGSENQCMECKYWTMRNGDILLVVNIHDATYEYPQKLYFLEFDRENGTMRELPTALSARWPLGEEAESRGIVYQVRYNSDGIVALVPQTGGDSFDLVTLKFDGETFR